MRRRKNVFWVALAAPGILWLAFLFIVPFYAVLSIAMGKLDQLIEAPVAVWNPLSWSSSGVIDVWRDIFGGSSGEGSSPYVVFAYSERPDGMLYGD